ncbi:Putative ribonuclease H protein [Arachis hypogaea]|nr:Putative ribonuclease H protein [Arachis hypogaea]
MDNLKAIEVEIFTILEGLCIAWNRDIKKLIVELDSKRGLELTANPSQHHPTLTRAIRRITGLVKRNWKVKMQHVLREANKIADGMANFILDSHDTFLFLEHPPAEITLSLFADICKVLFLRGS